MFLKQTTESDWEAAEKTVEKTKQTKPNCWRKLYTQKAVSNFKSRLSIAACNNSVASGDDLLPPSIHYEAASEGRASLNNKAFKTGTN